MRSWFPTCSYRASGPSISEQPNQMTPSFGSRRRGKGLALPKHLWEKRREKGSRSYQSEQACSAPCVLGLWSAYFYPLSDAMRGNRDVHGAKLPEPIVSCSRARSTGRAPRALGGTSHPPVRSQPKGAHMPVLSGADPAGSAGVGATADRLWQQLLRQPQHNVREQHRGGDREEEHDVERER